MSLDPLRSHAARLQTMEYLRSGTAQQRQAGQVLEALGFDEVSALREWVLAGTIPLDLAVEGSDLDVLIYAEDVVAARDELSERFGHRPGLARWPHGREADTWCLAFTAGGFPVEFFVQRVPVTEQRAFRHMVAEAALLEARGQELRERVLDLKRAGVKTEPAFAQALGLDLGGGGDPYLAMLDPQVIESALRR